MGQSGRLGNLNNSLFVGDVLGSYILLFPGKKILWPGILGRNYTSG
jgi:hypothetical protein